MPCNEFWSTGDSEVPHSIPYRNTSHECCGHGAVNDHVDRRLSAALRAQASGWGMGSSEGSASHARQAPPMLSGHEPPQARRRLPGWVVLAVAVLLGAMAGGLAGVISVW